jgi:cytochrome c553
VTPIRFLPRSTNRVAALGVPLAGLLLWSVPAIAEDAIGGDVIITKDMKPWEGCGECHDLNGVAPNGHFPNLAAQLPAYFRKQMTDFRDGRRSNDHGQMGTSSRDMTGAVLDQVVTYFSRLPPPPPFPQIDPEGASRAQLLIDEGVRAEQIPPCANCHGAHPKHDFNAPCLAAQQPGYIAKELRDFKTGRRANDPEGVMQKVAQKLSEPDIELLATYLASLQRSATGGAMCGERP